MNVGSWIASLSAGVVPVAAFRAAAAPAGLFLTGLDLADGGVLVDLAAFFAGGLAVLVLRAFEDTNTSRQRHRGAARPGNVKSRVEHCATVPVRIPHPADPSPGPPGQP